MKVVYTKVEESDAAIQQLAESTGEKASTIAAMVNQQRYRSAYNKLQQRRMKVVRELIKQHPELVKEVK